VWSTDRVTRTRKTEVFGEIPLPVSHCPPQIPQGLAGDRRQCPQRDGIIMNNPLKGYMRYSAYGLIVNFSFHGHVGFSGLGTWRGDYTCLEMRPLAGPSRGRKNEYGTLAKL
jgi:hypothetical protein